MSGYRRRRIYITILFLLVLFRIWLASGLTLRIYGNAVYDDSLLFDYAKSLMDGEWLGKYGMTTNLKGMVYSLFVALFYKLNIPYTTGIIILYLIACAVFVHALKPLTTNRYIEGALFVLLFYSPVMLTTEWVQRAYRMAIVPAFVLLVFGCQIGIYFHVLEKKAGGVIRWIVPESIVLPLFWYIREDSIWILPFIIVSIAIMVGKIINNSMPTKKKVTRIGMVLLPIAMVGIVTLGIGCMNYRYYGVFTTTELRLYLPDEYNTLIKNLKKIKPDVDIERVQIESSSIRAACKESPTLAGIQENIESYLNQNWRNWDGMIEGEIIDDYFWWAFREIMQQAGLYQDATVDQRFLSDVNKELEQAFKEGRLQQREKTGILDELIKDRKLILTRIFESAKQIIGYSICGIENVKNTNSGSDSMVRQMEVMSGSRVIYNSRRNINGWIFARKNDILEVKVVGEDGKEFGGLDIAGKSDDVYDVYHTENARRCRFNNTFILPEDQNIYADVYLGGEFYKRIPLEKGSEETDSRLAYCIDGMEVIEDAMPDEGQENVSIANVIVKGYKMASWIIFAFALLSYMYMFIQAIWRYRYRCRNLIQQKALLICTSFLLSFFALLFLVCFVYRNHGFTNSRHIYLAGAVTLMDLFKFYTITFVCLTKGGINFRDRQSKFNQ